MYTLTDLGGLTLDGWAALNLVVQIILPLLVGLVTTRATPGRDQALLLGALTLLATVATQVLTAHDQHQPINLIQIVVVALSNFLISGAAHFTIWKPVGLSAALLAVFSQKPVDAAQTDAEQTGAAQVVAPAAPVSPVTLDPAAYPLPTASVGPKHAADPAPATVFPSAAVSALPAAAWSTIPGLPDVPVIPAPAPVQPASPAPAAGPVPSASPAAG